jgi:E3 ubiquitin-protein ligase TRIP12
MTVYRFVHFNQTQTNEISVRNIWSGAHTINFKRVAGPPKVSTTLTPPPEASPGTESGVPGSVARNPTTSGILQLLSLLHGLNSNIDDLLLEKKDKISLVPEPSSQFVNTKLTAKLNRQLEEPLIVASNCLPSWSEDLARIYPFLFPFETRHLFLQSTSFGYSRSMSRWQNSQSNDQNRHDRHRDAHQFLGRTQRQKVRISRQDIFKAAIKVMDLYGSSPSILEVEYFEEVGTGLGPTLEFYSTVSKEFAKKKIKMWRENESSDNCEYAFGAAGLFPAPMNPDQANTENGKKVLSLFRSLGKFVARSMLDSRIIDVSFNPLFFRIGAKTEAVTPSLSAVLSVDSDLANSLKLLKKFATSKKDIDENPRLTPMQKVQKIHNITVDDTRIDDMVLDFTLPGYPSVDLIPGGSDVSVTIDNVAEYIDRVIDLTIGIGVEKQVEEFRSGFSSVFPYGALQAFTPSELVMLFGRNEEDWSLETLMDSIKADHGYNLDSRSVRNLLQVMSELTEQERRDFLQFVTGSPKLPIGGKLQPVSISVIFNANGNCRLQSTHTNVHCRLQAKRGTVHLRRLFAIGYDVRELSQTA